MKMFSSDRVFSVFSYDISHGLLLLRSGKERYGKNAKRVDILFQDVVSIECRMTIDGLEIKKENEIFLEEFKSKPSQIIEVGHNIFSISSKDWSGYVVAGSMTFFEDDRDFMASSSLF